MKNPWYRSTILPALFAMLIAGGFVLTQPGEIRKDAGEYDGIARSLVSTGTFSLDGEKTMLREPGYPVFRASLYALGASTQGILWVHVLLVGVVVFLIGITFKELEEKNAHVAAWGAALAYGFSNYASHHYSEVWATCLVAIMGWLALRSSKMGAFKYKVLLVVVGAGLCLTRINMILVPLLLFVAVAYSSASTWGARAKTLTILVLTWAALLTPWIVRNGRLFQEWNITSRSGIMLHARVQDAREPLSRLGASFVSVGTGQVTASALGLRPIVIQEKLRTTFWTSYNALLKEKGYTPLMADHALRQEAVQQLFTSPRILLAYIAWTPLEVLRLWALPSLLSPDFSIEGMFFPAWQLGQFTYARIFILGAAHSLQFLFWILLALSLYAGAKRYTWKWIPGLLFLAATIVQVPFDVIIRYGVPVQPWLWGAIAWYIGGPLWDALRAKHKYTKLKALFLSRRSDA